MGRVVTLNVLDGPQALSKSMRDRLSRLGVEVRGRKQQADYFLVMRAAFLKNRMTGALCSECGVLHWTNEPRLSMISEPYIKINGIPTRVLNVYAGGVYVDNYLYHHRGQVPEVDDQAVEWPPRRPEVVGVACCGVNHIYGSIVVGGRNVDLAGTRHRLLTGLFDLGVAKIHGKHWPSRFRAKRIPNKMAVLKEYPFNLCLENTNWPFYCTEKLWDAIRGGCLPIYWGKGNRIYDDFPKDSFLDAAEFDDVAALAAYIRQMSRAEYFDRLRACRAVYNEIGARLQREEHHPWMEAARRLVQGLKEIAVARKRLVNVPSAVVVVSMQSMPRVRPLIKPDQPPRRIRIQGRLR